MGKRINYPLDVWIDSEQTWWASKGHQDKKQFFYAVNTYKIKHGYERGYCIDLDDIKHGWFTYDYIERENVWYYFDCEKSTPKSIPLTYVYL